MAEENAKENAVTDVKSLVQHLEEVKKGNGDTVREMLAQKLGDEIIEERVEFLSKCIKHLQHIEKEIKDCKPDASYCTEVTGGDFAKHDAYSVALADRIIKLKKQRSELSEGIDATIKGNPTSENYDNLEKILNRIYANAVQHVVDMKPS